MKTTKLCTEYRKQNIMFKGLWLTRPLVNSPYYLPLIHGVRCTFNIVYFNANCDLKPGGDVSERTHTYYLLHCALWPHITPHFALYATKRYKRCSYNIEWPFSAYSNPKHTFFYTVSITSHAIAQNSHFSYIVFICVQCKSEAKSRAHILPSALWSPWL